MLFSFLSPLKKYAEFHGRADRGEFWPFLIFIYAVLSLFLAAATVIGHFEFKGFMLVYLRFGSWLSLFNLIMFLPLLAVTVRRLHDLGRTGWWLALPFAVSIVAYIVFLAFNSTQMMAVLMQMSQAIQTHGGALAPADTLAIETPLLHLMLPWVALPSLIAQIAFYILCAQPGMTTGNRYGPAPKNAAAPLPANREVL